MSIPNRWHLRRVAETNSKACEICYKSTPCVLITPDSRDFFYVCNSHLSDKGFCSPVIDEQAVQKAAQEAKEREIELVKREFEEKQRKKEEKKKAKEKDKDKDTEKEKVKKDEEKKDDEKDEDNKNKQGNDCNDKSDNSGALKSGDDSSPTSAATAPRIFTLQKDFFQFRLDRIRKAAIAKRNRDRLTSPATFPAVPSGNP